MALTKNQRPHPHVEENPYKPGAGDARLKEYGVPVWALVGYWRLAQEVGEGVERVARDYDLPEEMVEAALDFYFANRCAIDERLAANESPAPV